MTHDVRTVWPELKPGPDENLRWVENRPDYPAIIKLFGEVIIDESDNAYQGDSYILLRDTDGQFGYLTFGWGSCSGCDALEACYDLDDLQALVDQLEQSIKWGDLPSIKTYVASADDRNEWYTCESTFKSFRERLGNY